MYFIICLTKNNSYTLIANNADIFLISLKDRLGFTVILQSLLKWVLIRVSLGGSEKKKREQSLIHQVTKQTTKSPSLPFRTLKNSSVPQLRHASRAEEMAHQLRTLPDL